MGGGGEGIEGLRLWTKPERHKGTRGICKGRILHLGYIRGISKAHKHLFY